MTLRLLALYPVVAALLALAFLRTHAAISETAHLE